MVAEVEDLIFDRDTIKPWCPADLHPVECSQEKMKVKITTTIKNPENKDLIYYYNVSGGRIVGEGANVIWDFTDARIGHYTISIGVGKDNIIPGKVITKTLDFVECDICDIPCECPVVIISGPMKNAKSGDSMIFTASASGGGKDVNFSFKWSVSGGIITAGQDTSQIIVKTNPAVKKGSVTATVELGEMCHRCPPTTASKTALVTETQP